MSWGMLIPDPSGGLLIDSAFVGHYLGAESPAYFNAEVNRTLPVFGSYWPLPHPARGVHLTDIIFSRPAGPIAEGTASTGITNNEQASVTGVPPVGVRGPGYVLHYKSLASHPVGVSGYGLAVWDAFGQQAFNSSAHRKRLDVVALGTASLSGEVGTRWSFAPTDSIANYYALANSCWSMLALNPGVGGIGAQSRGWSYIYDFTNNRITVGGDPGGTYLYCIAKVSG